MNKQPRINQKEPATSVLKTIFFGLDRVEKILLLIGLILLTARFVYYPSVFHDEAVRILKIQQSSFWDLIALPQLGMVHDARGFLVFVKRFSLFLPAHELSFRLPVFFCSLLGCLMFLRLSRHFLTPAGRYAAMGLYILCPYLIQYSSQVRPYACDVLLSVLILLMFFRLSDSDLRSIRARLGYALGGVLALVSSLPAFFTLASGALVLCIQMLLNQEKEKIKRFLFMVLFWAFVWTAYYFRYMHYYTQWAYLISDWEQNLIPSSGSISDTTLWFLRKMLSMFSNPLGLWPWAGLPLWVIGIISFFRQNRFKLFLLISPFLMMSIAVWMGTYPLHGRVQAFLLPMHLILIGQGWQVVFDKIRKAPHSRWLIVLIGCGLFFAPLTGTWHEFERNHANYGISSLLDYIKANWQKGDGIYVLRHYRYDFQFLRQRYKIASQDFVQGRCGECGDYFRTEMGSLDKYRRVWFVLGGGHKQWQQRILKFADQRGVLIDKYRQGWFRTYLYEWEPLLTPEPSPPRQ